MDTFLIFAVTLAVISILFVWYITKYRGIIPDDVQLMLGGDEDKILFKTYETYCDEIPSAYMDNTSIAAIFLMCIYNKNFNENLIVVLETVDEGLYNFSKSDLIINLRDILGIKGYIAVVHDDKTRNALVKNSTFVDISRLMTMIEAKILLESKQYLETILNERWKIIREIADTRVVNNTGSYLYIGRDYIVTSVEKTKDYDIIPNVRGKEVVLNNKHYVRINLLCSNVEFTALIRRWKQQTTNTR